MNFHPLDFSSILDYITLLGALEDFDKVAKKDSKGDSSKQSDSAQGAVLADLPPGWTDEFLK